MWLLLNYSNSQEIRCNSLITMRTKFNETVKLENLQWMKLTSMLKKLYFSKFLKNLKKFVNYQ